MRHRGPDARGVHALRIVAFMLALASLAHAGSSARAREARPAWLFARGGPRLVVTRRVRTGSQPKSVSVSPDGRQVWVAAFGTRDANNVDVFDAHTLALWGRVSFQGNAVETIFTPDGRTAYVSNFVRGTVEEIDVATRTVRASIVGGLDPKVLALSSDARRLYIVNWRSNDVYVVDTATRERLQRLRTGRHPRGFAVLRDGRVLVASTETNTVYAFDANGVETRRIEVCDFPRHLVLSNDEQRLYVTCSGHSLVAAYEVATGQRVFGARTGNNPRSLAATRDGRYLVTADFDGTSVTLVDVIGRVARPSPIERASQIVGVAVSPAETLRVYATSWNTRELILMEPAR